MKKRNEIAEVCKREIDPLKTHTSLLPIGDLSHPYFTLFFRFCDFFRLYGREKKIQNNSVNFKISLLQYIS